MYSQINPSLSILRGYLECFTCLLLQHNFASLASDMCSNQSSAVRESMDDSQLLMCVSDCAGTIPRSFDHPAALSPQPRSLYVGWSHRPGNKHNLMMLFLVLICAINLFNLPQLDGFIARTWPNQKSALGSALDPLADKILISVLYVSLTYAELIPGTSLYIYELLHFLRLFLMSALDSLLLTLAPLTALVICRDIGLIAAVFWVRYKTVPPPVRHTPVNFEFSLLGIGWECLSGGFTRNVHLTVPFFVNCR